MAEFVKPPRGTERVLRWFVSAGEFPLVLGDLSEELQERARALGEARARRWYWRETVRTAWIFADCRPWRLAWIVGMAASSAAVLRWVEWVLFLLTPVAVVGQTHPALRYICGVVACGVAALAAPLVLGCVASWVTGNRWATAALFAATFTGMNVAIARSYLMPQLHYWSFLHASWAVWFFLSYECVAVAVFVAGAAAIRQKLRAAVYRAA